MPTVFTYAPFDRQQLLCRASSPTSTTSTTLLSSPTAPTSISPSSSPTPPPTAFPTPTALTGSYFFLANSHILSPLLPMMKFSNSRNYLEYKLMIMNL
jgi:hypothetical protein